MTRIPKYCRHKTSGRAYVRVKRRFVFLGKYGSTESHQKYRRIIAAYLTGESGEVELPPAQERDAPFTVSELANQYLVHCRNYYTRDGELTQEFHAHRYLLNKFASIADTPAQKVRPRHLKTLRDEWIAAGNSRRYVNKTASRIVRMFRWGVEEELIKEKVWRRLRAVKPLAKRRTLARESKPVRPASLDDVNAMIQHMPDDIADMARLQLLTAARPSELWHMRPSNLDRTRTVWRYVPDHHKCEHHDKPRTLYVGPHGQKVLASYLLRPAGQLCFPRGNGKEWDRHAYRREFHRACALAGVPNINPYQLRHNCGTQVREQFGLDGSQVILGHAHAAVSELYAELDHRKAEQIARRMG